MNINRKFLNQLLIYLYCLLPLLLITGPLLSDLSVVLITLIFIIISINNKNIEIFKNRYFLVFASFCIIITIRSIFSEDIKLSILSSSFYIRFGLFSLAIFYLLEKNLDFIFILKNIFIIIILILFFDSAIQFIFGKNIIGFEYNNQQNFRVTSFFGDDEVLGSYVARFFPFILSLIFFHEYKTQKKINKIYLIIFIIIFFILVFLSGERTAFALLALSSLLIFLSSRNLRKHLFISFIAVSIGIFLISQISPKIKNRMFDSAISQLGLNDSSERPVLFGKIYESHYKIAFNMFKEKPIFGHGVKMFRVYCQKPENYVAPNGCTTHPHNIYMQFLAETGILGFLYLISAFFLLSYFILKNIYLNIFKRFQLISDHKVCILIFYFVTLFPIAPSGSFFNNWMSIIYYLPAGFFLYLVKNDF